MTTAQLFPLMPTEVMLAAVIALKAYSREDVSGLRDGEEGGSSHTDLVETTLVREDGDVSVKTRAACAKDDLLAPMSGPR